MPGSDYSVKEGAYIDSKTDEQYPQEVREQNNEQLAKDINKHLQEEQEKKIKELATVKDPAIKEVNRKITVVETKQFRVELDAVLQKIKKSNRTSRERSLCITKIQEGIMWLGMDLKDLNEANPYPNSYDPTNTKIEPTADGLKL